MDRNERDTDMARKREAEGDRWHRVPRESAWREVTIAGSLAENAVMWVHLRLRKD